MRVLYCIPSMEGGGTERQVTYLVGELVRNGCDVHVALVLKGQNFTRLQATGATIHMLGPSGNHDPRLLRRMQQTVARIQPDVCQCWLLQMEVVGGLACTWQGAPWLFSERSSEKAYPRTVKNRLRIRIATLADGIVSNSAAGDAYWQTRVSGRVKRYVVPNGLPLDQIAAAPAASAADAGFAGDEPLVLCAGRLDSGKNAEAFLRAIARISPARPLRAMLCGEGPQRAYLDRLVIELGLANRVRISPYAANLWGLMKRAAVLVSPSRFEGSPNVVLEAMASGCPLVVSDIPAHRELLDERSAMFAPPDDAVSMAARIEDVLADAESGRHRARVAREQAERHGLAAVARQYLDVYRDVLSRTARSAVTGL